MTEEQIAGGAIGLITLAGVSFIGIFTIMMVHEVGVRVVLAMYGSIALMERS